MAVSLQAEKLTHPGLVRDQNEDYCDFRLPSNAEEMGARGALFVVADGMGGADAGRMASMTGGVAIVEQYYGNKTASDVKSALREAVRAANSEVREMGLRRGWQGAGSTAVCAVVRGEELTVANVGDSRAYLIRGAEVTQLTEDHTWVHERVKGGHLTPEQAATDRRRNAITRSLGNHPDIEVEISQHQLADGDALVLCTDGLTGASYNAEPKKGEPRFATPADIRDIVGASPSPGEAARRLIELANRGGGPDNITTIVIFYGQHHRVAGSAAKPLALAAAALIALAGVAYGASGGFSVLGASDTPNTSPADAAKVLNSGSGSDSNGTPVALIGKDGQPVAVAPAGTGTAAAGALRAPTSTVQPTPTATPTPPPTFTSAPIPTPTPTAVPPTPTSVPPTNTPSPTATNTKTATPAPTPTPIDVIVVDPPPKPPCKGQRC